MTGGFGVSPGVAWAGSTADEVVVARVPEGPPYALGGPAATIWAAALGAPDADAVVARVSERTGVAAEVIDADVRALLADLVALGLLEAD